MIGVTRLAKSGRAVLGLLLLCGGVSSAHAQYGLVDAGWIHQDSQPVEPRWIFDTVAIGDVDGDGRDDLVSVTTNNDVRIQYQRADGTLSETRIESMIAQPCPPSDPPCPDSQSYGSAPLVLADMDGNGGQEIVYAHKGGLAIIGIDRKSKVVARRFRYDGIPAEYDTPYIQAVDVDQDGKRDIVAAVERYDDTILMLLFKGDGRGGLAEPQQFDTLAGMFDGMLAGDLDGDGVQDLAIVRTTSMQSGLRAPVDVYFGTPSGVFQPRQAIGVDENTRGSVPVFADVTGDGLRDLVHGDIVYRQGPARVFDVVTDVSGASLENVLGEDIDGDGNDDLAFVGEVNSYVRVRLQSVRGTLSPPMLFPLPASNVIFPRGALASGDLNGDRCTDMAVAAGTRGLMWFLGTGCAPRPDLEISLAVSAGGVKVSIRNIGSADAGSIALALGSGVATGNVSFTSLPGGCTTTPVGEPNGAAALCQLGSLSPGEVRTLDFPLQLSSTNGNWLSAQARVSTTTRELDTANNAASRKIKVGTLAGRVGPAAGRR